MRDYSQITPAFWTGATGKQIRALGHEARCVATYLLSGPSANMIGLYYLPIATIAYECGSSLEGASKALRSLCEVGFCEYDEWAEVVWVVNMARVQIGDTLKPNDKRVKGVERELDATPKSFLVSKFHDKYRACFGLGELKSHKPLRSPSKAPSKPLRSQEQEQEQDQEQERSQRSLAIAREEAPTGLVSKAATFVRAFNAALERHGKGARALTPTPKDFDHAEALVAAYDDATLSAAVEDFMGAAALDGAGRNLGFFRAKVGDLVRWRAEHPGVAYGARVAPKVETIAEKAKAATERMMAKLQAQEEAQRATQ